jgi:hypothetical protein
MKRTHVIPVIVCQHVMRECKGTNLRECTICYELEETYASDRSPKADEG